MRTIQQQRNYEKLEQLPPQIRELVSLELRRLWHAWVEVWNFIPGEPRVRQTVDRNGNMAWQVYEPLHDCTLSFDDEQKLLVWLDEQHYRKTQPKLWDI
jgi:hypothetical protein